MKKKIWLLLALLMAIASVMFACVDDVEEKILLTASGASVKPGETIQLTADVEGVAYSLVDSDNLATVSATGLITAKADATVGSTIKAVAKKGDVTSNVVQIAVVAAETEEKILLTAAVPLAKPGGSVQLTSDVTGVTYSLVDSDAIATVSASGLISVKADAEVGAIIKAVAKKGTVTSNTVQIVIVGAEKIILSASSSSAQPGGTVQLVSDVDDVTYDIIDGDESATVDADGLVTIESDAVIGTIIEIVAQNEENVSNSVYIEVIDIPVTSIDNAQAAAVRLERGESTTLSFEKNPSNATQEVVWVITNGYAKATITENTLTVASDAPLGEIVLMAKAGEVISDIVTIEVIENIPLTAISINVGSTQIEVARGGQVQLTATLTPSDTTETDYEWEILTAGAKASISATGLLTVEEDASLGDEIDVIAKRGEIESEPVTIKVAEISYHLNSLTDSEITFANTDTTAMPTILYSVTDDKGKPVAGMIIEFEIEEGEDVIEIETPGMAFCQIRQLAHGVAKVKVILKDEDENVHDTDYVNIMSIKTPNDIFAPDYIEASIALKGMTAYSVGKDQAFDYQARVPSTGVNAGACTDVSYTFELLDNTDAVIASGDAVGVLADGKITFAQIGKIRVRATTNSGNASDKERSVAQIFDVNEHININNWEDLKVYLQGGVAGDTRALNFVVTQRPASGYGFSIVPKFVLNGGFTTENLNELKALYSLWGDLDGIYYMEHIQIIVIDRNVLINGNNHAIDFSKMPTIAFPESRNVIQIEGSDWQGGPHGGSAKKELWYLAKSIGVNQPNVAGSLPEMLNPEFTTAAPVYKVEFNNMKFYGNIGIDGKNLDGTSLGGSGTGRQGTATKAIEIGYYLTRANFDIKMNNIEIKNFAKGASIHRAVSETYQTQTYESKISNLRIDEIYGTGIEFAMSQIEMNNATFGFTGAGPFEALNQFNTMAGLEENQNQKIVISGSYDPGHANNGNTQYYLDYSISAGSATIRFHELMNMILIELSMNHKNHVHFTGGAFMFSGFVLNDPMYAGTLEAAVNSLASDIPSAIPTALLGITGAKDAILGLIVGKIARGVQTKVGHNFTEVEFNTGDSVLPLDELDNSAINTTHRFVAMAATVDGAVVGSPGTSIPIGTVYVVNANYTAN